MKIKTKKPNKKWLKLARQRGFTLRTGEQHFLPLKKILLNIGGWSVCTALPENNMQDLLTRGRKFPGKSKTMSGEQSQCHRNSAYCWDANQDKCKICTGYALTRDGMWRQHSWIISNSGLVIETTVKRIQYFGFILTEEECGDFFMENC